MIYNWFYIFNYDAFLALELPSMNLSLTLQGIGAAEIMVTHGETVGITYDGVFLSLGINDKNPFEFDGYAIFKDANNNVWLGFET